jgi:folate-binding protein YgfZ
MGEPAKWRTRAMTEFSSTSTNRLTLLPNRGVLRLSGADRVSFLQGLVSNDVESATPGNAVYACMLTPQGKFLHDFFLIADGDSLLIECEADRREDLMRRLKMYKLRAKIELSDCADAFSVWSTPTPPPNLAGLAYRDPRSPSLGYRLLRARPETVIPDSAPFEDYDRLRIALGVPDGSRDMEIGKAILLENNIDLLNGVTWDKGCYTGQELTARTHYRGLIKKRLAPVGIAGEAPAIGTPITENGVEIGEMRSSSGDLGLALLRLDFLRQQRPVAFGDVTLTPTLPEYLMRFLEQVPA